MNLIRQGRLLSAALVRKLWMVSRRVPRAAKRLQASDADYRQRPPIVVTTVPKSGTHLVHQVVAALPGTVDYGTFLATRASYRRKSRTTRSIVRRIKRLAPGEILRAHLVHQPEVVDALRSKRAFIIFVYRDPRDVLVSEAHYLTNLAPWHVLHREFAHLSPKQRVDVAIDGLASHEDVYPNIRKRFDLFAHWLEDADITLRFEDLVSENQTQTIRSLVHHYSEVSTHNSNIDQTAVRAIEAIDPSRSHTYREGRIGSWREALSPEQVARFEIIASSTLHRFGYSPVSEARQDT